MDKTAGYDKLSIVFFLTIIFLLGITFVSSSYAQNDESVRIIFGQLIVRDSNDNLIAYLESSDIRNWDDELIEKSMADAKIISSEKTSIEGRLYEKIIFEKRPIPYVTESQRGVTILGVIGYGVGHFGASFMNDGYFHLEDDKITAIWTALRLLE